MKERFFAIVLIALLTACSRKADQAPSETTGSASTQRAASYSPRIGVGVNTGARTCIAIQNSSLQSGSPVTLVTPLAPQSFVQAQVTGPSSAACPVSKDLNPALSSYDVKAEQGSSQKLVPIIAVVGASTPFSTSNNLVQADLDQNGKTETFRACTAPDGYHLTAWGGSSLTGTLLWHGYYYEPDNPGTGPACTPKEATGP
ncbi:MAG: hypothetical protein JWP08_472 [Bryobacterales bacterium]|nr:hypothetical protein [Bryobacterales bacterium]